jgi:hypothetical protein
MSAWSTISAKDVFDYLAAEQVSALESEALGEEQDDPLPTIIRDIAVRIRAEIRANPSNVVDSVEYSIPPELRGAGLALVIEAAQSRLPGLDLSDDQIRLANAARALLKRVATGEIPVVAGEEATGTQPRIVVVRSRKNTITGRSLAGL